MCPLKVNDVLMALFYVLVHVSQLTLGLSELDDIMNLNHL